MFHCFIAFPISLLAVAKDVFNTNLIDIYRLT
jgi:hypothetical protein